MGMTNARRGCGLALAATQIEVLALAILAALPAGGALASAQQVGSVVEQGKFRLHKFEQAIGEETYQIQRDGESLAVKVDFKFTDRFTAVPLAATFRGAADFTPQMFEIKGKTSQSSSIDEAVEVQAGRIRIRNRDQWSEISPPGRFFTIAGYAPATMQMLMVRYWAKHGSPGALATLPTGSVKIEARGDRSLGHGHTRTVLTQTPSEHRLPQQQARGHVD
jgi:hypothetical protein